MIEKVTMYSVTCDNCGEDLGATSDYCAWHDESQARDVAIDSDWLITEDENEKHICPNCFQGYDDNDKPIIKPKNS